MLRGCLSSRRCGCLLSLFAYGKLMNVVQGREYNHNDDNDLSSSSTGATGPRRPCVSGPGNQTRSTSSRAHQSNMHKFNGPCAHSARGPDWMASPNQIDEEQPWNGLERRGPREGVSGCSRTECTPFQWLPNMILFFPARSRCFWRIQRWETHAFPASLAIL